MTVVKRKEIKVVEVCDHFCNTCKKQVEYMPVQLDTRHSDGYDEYGSDELEFCSEECMKRYSYLGLSYDTTDTVKITLTLTVKEFKERYRI